MTKHMTVERDLRENENSAPGANGETLCPKAAMKTASNSRWGGYAGTISIEHLENGEMHRSDLHYD